MIPGSFCLRREAEQVRRWMYWSFKTFASSHRREKLFSAYNYIVDFYAGTGCLTELALRALTIHGSYGKIAQVILIDRKPRVQLFVTMRERLAAMPDVGLKIKVKFETNDESIKDIVTALNDYRTAIHDRNVRGRRTFRTQSPAFRPVVLNALRQAGKVRLHIIPAEERIKRAQKSHAKDIFKVGTLFILDPPRANTHSYYIGKNRSVANPFEVIKILDEHNALVLYVNYISAVSEIINSTNFRPRSWYTLYSSGSASRHSNYRVVMTFLVPKKLIKNSTNIDISKKWHIPGIDELKDPLAVSRLNEPRLAELDYPPRDFRYVKKKQGLLR